MPRDFRDLACNILDACKACFGESVKYVPKVGAPFDIRGIFDNQFEQVDPDTEIVVASNQPTLGIKLADLPLPPAKGDKVFVRDLEYRVIDSQEDGVAGAVLFLHRTGC